MVSTDNDLLWLALPIVVSTDNDMLLGVDCQKVPCELLLTTLCMTMCARIILQILYSFVSLYWMSGKTFFLI